MIPLINVVFLMLAFFMMAGQIQSPDNVELETPISLSDTDRERNSVTISLDLQERLYINGVPSSLENLTNQLESFGVRSDRASHTQVMVRADGRLPASSTREVLTALRKAGLTQVSLATIQTPSSRG